MRPRSVEFTLDNIQYRAVAEYDDALGYWYADVWSLAMDGTLAQVEVGLIADDAISALQGAASEIIGRHLRGELSAL